MWKSTTPWARAENREALLWAGGTSAEKDTGRVWSWGGPFWLRQQLVGCDPGEGVKGAVAEVKTRGPRGRYCGERTDGTGLKDILVEDEKGWVNTLVTQPLGLVMLKPLKPFRKLLSDRSQRRVGFRAFGDPGASAPKMSMCPMVTEAQDFCRISSEGSKNPQFTRNLRISVTPKQSWIIRWNPHAGRCPVSPADISKSKLFRFSGGRDEGDLKARWEKGLQCGCWIRSNMGLWTPGPWVTMNEWNTHYPCTYWYEMMNMCLSTSWAVYMWLFQSVFSSRQ